jgi:hypothetical protein
VIPRSASSNRDAWVLLHLLTGYGGTQRRQTKGRYVRSWRELT